LPIPEARSSATFVAVRSFIARGSRAASSPSFFVKLSPRDPVFWAALAFAAGIWIGKYAWRPPTWWIGAACACILASAYFRRQRSEFASILALAAFVYAGGLAVQSSAAGPQAIWLGNGEPVQITAHVVSEGNLQRENIQSTHQQIDVETETVESEGLTRRVRTGIRLNIYSKDASLEQTTSVASEVTGFDITQLLHYGQRVRFTTVLIPPRNFRNPGAFDYAGYLHDEGIAATASVKYGEIEQLPGFSGSRGSFYLAGIRRSILGRIHALWPEQSADLLDAMLLGEKSFIERPTRADFQRSGTYHMLIVAGLHVGILAIFAMWSFRRVGLGPFAASVLTITLIFVYAALTKEGSPVWRAALMIAVYLLAQFLYRRRAVLNALGTAALALLVARPNALFGASFQMSFLCVALIAGIAVPYLERTIEPFARGVRNLDALAWDRSLPPRVAQFRIDLRMVFSRANLGKRSWFRRACLFSLKAFFRVAQLVVISAVMQFGMALPMAFYFHRATAVATFANVLAVPLLQVLMPSAVLAVAVSYVWLSPAKIPAAFAAFALHAIAGTVRWLGGLRIADVRLPTPAFAIIVGAGFMIFAAVFLFRRSARISLASMALIVLSAVGVWKLHPREEIRRGVLEMTAIDVGQGDSQLLVLPDRRKLLVDAGGLPFWTHSQMDIGEDVVSPYLWSRGISHIDAIALTHAHADHMGGFPAVIANFSPTELWLSEGIPEEEIQPLLEQAARFNVRIVYHKAGDSFTYGGAQVRVLAPDPDFPIRVAHRNDESLVMKISYGKTSALLEADAERGTERLVASEHPEADVLKVAHHGSATSTEPELLSAVHPKFAVISVGLHNVYHHPRREVLQRLQQSAVTTYRTDLDGATTFYLDGSRVTPQIALVP